MTIQQYTPESIQELNNKITNNRHKVDQFLRDYNEIKKRLNAIPQRTLSEVDLEVQLASIQLTHILDHMFNMAIDYSRFLDDERETPDDGIKLFTLYWRTGERKVIAGINIEAAFAKNSYSIQDIDQLSWYDVGVTNTHEWNSKKKEWGLKVKLK